MDNGMITAPETPADRSEGAARSAATRSAVTNGSRLFVEGDGRGPWARRFRDLLENHAEDLGGAEGLSEAQRALIRRAATLAVECERMESTAAQGGDMDLGTYATVTNALRRVLADLGIERKPRDVTPKLHEILAGAGR